MFNHNLIKRSLIVGLTTATVAFPAAAQAMHAEDSGGVVLATQVPATEPGIDQLQSNDQQSFAAHSQSVSRTPSSTTATATSGNGFQWGDAGIGAGSAVVLLGVSGLGAAAMRRRRPQRTLAS
jgi:hypothetical protein